jgi:hypothetical protein
MADQQLPAYLLNAPPSKITQKLSVNLSTGQPPYISIQGGRFTLVDTTGAQEPVLTVDAKTGQPYLDCAIVDVGDHQSRIYYSKPFEPGASSYAPPDCWSDNGKAPSVNASLPQAKTCTPDPTGVFGCKWAVWGSKISANGKAIPACGQYHKLAIAIPNDDVIFLLRVPPNSLRNLGGYNKLFEGQPIGIDRVLTRISFAGAPLGTLTFQAIGLLDEETLRFGLAAIAQGATDSMVGRHDRPREYGGEQQALEAPTRPAPVPPPQPAPQPAPPPQPAAVIPGVPGGGPAAGAAPARRPRRRPVTEAAPEQPKTAPFVEQPPHSGQFGIATGLPPNPEVTSVVKGIFNKQ